MKIAQLICLAGAALVSTGCVVHTGGTRVVRTPAPPPRVVVVHPPAQPPPPVVVVRPPPRDPPPQVVVVKPPRHDPPPQVVVVKPPPRDPSPKVVVVEPPASRNHDQRRPVVDRPAADPPRGRVERKNDVVHTPPGHAKRDPAPHVVVFSPQERDIICTHAKKSNGAEKGGKKDKGLPPGLAKKAARGGELPPGWQNKCVRGEVISAEVYKRCEPLPHEVVVKLPPPPPGTIVVTLEGKVFRLARATLEILDVFDVL